MGCGLRLSIALTCALVTATFAILLPLDGWVRIAVICGLYLGLEGIAFTLYDRTAPKRDD